MSEITTTTAHVCPGDTITHNDGLFTFTARLEYDHDTQPEEHGFDPDDPIYGKENAAICAAWRRDEWFYCGVVISAAYNGVTLPNDYLASLWGIEANFNGDNSYLFTVARELLPEAKAEAQKLLETTRTKLMAT